MPLACDSQQPAQLLRTLELQPREAMRIDWLPVGNAHALVIDNVYRDPDAVRAFALSLAFNRPAGNYPGFFASAPLHSPDLERLLAESVASGFHAATEVHPFYRDLTFALTTKSLEELSLTQSIPHYDTFCDFAGVLYLNPPGQCSGGTSFWKHRATGLTMLPGPNDPTGQMLASIFGAKDGPDLVSWCIRDTIANCRSNAEVENFWECIAVLPMQYNRLVLYDSRLFHMPQMTSSFGNTLETRRLTQNLYRNLQSTERR